MGDRAVVIFHDKTGGDISPGIYLHWCGSNVPEWLKIAGARMRRGDPSYAAARFCGYCHEMIDGNLGLGLLTPAEDLSEGNVAAENQGDAGVFLVNVDTGEVRNWTRAGWQEPFTIQLGGD